MQRVIKFRAKAKLSPMSLNISGIPHKNGWVYGAYVDNDDRPYIISHDIAEVCDEYIHPAWWCPVVPGTVGQYTGLEDKNGVDIYEGDIIKAVIPRRGIWGEITLANGAVYYVESSFRLLQNEYSDLWVRLDSLSLDVEMEVIDNIHDNPDLPEVTP